MIHIFIKILLFILYPVVTYLLISKNTNHILLSLIVSIGATILVIFLEKNKKGQIAILDVSAVKDERIIDFIDSNLFQKFLLPRFVLREIETQLETTPDKNIENNIEKLKRNNKISILYKNYFKIQSTDFKILKLSKDLKMKIITTNFNLSKMASIKNIKVVDINDLYERLKPTVLPGYKISVFLVKEGKDKNQAIGFLDDGTTVVAEDGKNFIGKKVNLKIASILHSSSNKMLFGKIEQDNFF